MESASIISNAVVLRELIDRMTHSTPTRTTRNPSRWHKRVLEGVCFASQSLFVHLISSSDPPIMSHRVGPRSPCTTCIPPPPPFHKSIFITDDSLSGWITAATAWYHDLGIQVVGNGRFFKFEKRDSAGACLFEFTSPSCSIEVISRIEMERMNDLDFITTMKPMWFENQTWNDYLRFSED